MNISEAFKDRIKSSVRLSDVVGKRVKLRRKGKEFLGLSPFSNEKTPSFTVNDEKRFYQCFSTGKNGDVFSFIMDFENLRFPDAVRLICEEYGIEHEGVTAIKVNNDLSKMLYCVNDASLFFEKCLFEGGAANARQHLRSRGLTRTALSKFNIGYSPKSFDATLEHLKSKGYSEEIIIKCGLAIKYDNGKVGNKFRDRIMFPIKDNLGRVVAFGGRSLNPKKEAKYINSRETPIFKKGETLYNIDNARRHVSDKEPIIIVEGYMDCVALSMAGIEGCVSAMGTAVTQRHMEAVWRLCKEPVLCMDGDRAGRQASYSIVKKILPFASHNKSASFMFLPDDLDPDDYIAKYGAHSFRSQIENPISMVDFIWSKEKDMIPLDTPERKSDLRNRIFSTTETIENKNVKYYYRKELLTRFDSEIKDSWKIKKTYLNPQVGIMTDAIYSHEKNLSCIPILYPNIGDEVKGFLSSVRFININAENIRSIYLKCLNNGDYENIDECVIINIDEDDLKYLDEIKKTFLKTEEDAPLTKEEVLNIWDFSKERYEEVRK